MRCVYETCTSPAYSRGLCIAHYAHASRGNIEFPQEAGWVRYQRYEKTCPQCGEIVITKAVNAKWCSQRCYHRNKKGLPKYPSCRTCGCEIVTLNGKVKYCSDDCRQQALGIRQVKRRVWAHEVAYEPISRNTLGERDEWICQICDDPIDTALAWPDPFSASIDHIIPLSRGGSHLYSNVQITHLRCNLKKHTTIIEEHNLPVQ